MASSPGLISGTSSSFTIIAKALTSISLTSDNSSPSVYFSFGLSCKLYDQSLNLWTTSSTVAITSNPSIIAGNTLSTTTATGSADFSVYSTASGSVTIYCKSGTVTGSLTLTILQDLIKINSVTPNVIYN